MYKEYLKSIEVLSEEDFNNVLEAFPKKEIDFNKIDHTDISQSKEGFAWDLMDYFIRQWDDVYLRSFDWNDKTYEVCTQSYEDLKEIKEFFGDTWTMSNEKKELRNILDKKLNNLSKEELNKLINQL